MNLVVRQNIVGSDRREAVYSTCQKYRYSLTCTWNSSLRRLLIVMLNPSTATELSNDPTIERCERRARALGYGAMRICNLFALRETSPARLLRAGEPVGDMNADQIGRAVLWADDILSAWGVHGAHLGQDKEISAILDSSGKPVLALGLTKAGHPRHPLYVSYAVRPVPLAPIAAGRWPDSTRQTLGTASPETPPT